MRDVLDDVRRWWEAGESVGMATVVATWSSAPRRPGAAMAVGPDGTVAGNVSGGCVDGAVYELCRDVVSAHTVSFGAADDFGTVGLPCGGTIELLIERISPSSFPNFPVLADAVAHGEPVALITGTAGPPTGRHLVLTSDGRSGSLGGDRIDDAATDDGRGLLAAGRTGLLRYGPNGQRRGTGATLLVHTFAPPARMLVFGATDHAAAVAGIGTFLGYRVTVCDARPVFTTARRFAKVDEVVVDWPHRYLAAEAAAGRVDSRTVVCVLTHDPKFDVPLLEVALRLPLGYVGAMGSRRTHDDRLKRLQEAGLSDAELARLTSPIGLDLGARTPEETAVSVAAEIIASRWGGTGRRLTDLEGPIH